MSQKKTYQLQSNPVAKSKSQASQEKHLLSSALSGGWDRNGKK